MFRNLLIAILAIGVVGLGYWGYTEHRKSQALMVQSENHYQQSFHELTYYVDKIHDNLGQSLATNKTSHSTSQLTEVWRLSNQARSDIGKLPLSLMSFSNTSQFLSKLGNFTFNTAIKNPNKNGLSSQEYKQLETLYNESSKVEKDLRSVQDTILTNHLKWTDVAQAVNSKTPKDNQIVDGIRTMNQKVASFDQTFQQPTFNNPMGDLKKLDTLSGNTINKGEAISLAKKFVDIPPTEKADIQKLGKGADYNAYDLTFNGPSNNQSTSVAITQRGGHITWYLKHRKMGKQTLSLHQAIGRAQKFLKAKGYAVYQEVTSDQYDTVGVISFAKKEKNVLVYPDSVKVKVALDNGEILGFDQTEHLITEVSKLPSFKPKLTEKQARSDIRESVQIQNAQLVIYKNGQHKDVLCYEFLSTKGSDTYRILINANSGMEENVNLLNA